MTAKRVLLVEDHAAYATQFRHALNDDVDIFYAAEDFLATTDTGWKYAFVDFDLAGAKTGLSVMHRLKTTSPSTKVVAFSELGDSGRVLGAAAAKVWFNVWAVMTKGAAAHEEAIKQVVNLGVDPTPEVWRRRLNDDGWRINLLFQQEHWIELWPRWRKANGSRETVLRANAGMFKQHQIREFAEKATDAVQTDPRRPDLRDSRGRKRRD